MLFANNWKRLANHLDSRLKTQSAVIFMPGEGGFPKISVNRAGPSLDKLTQHMAGEVYMLPWVSNGEITLVVASYNIAAAWQMLITTMIAVVRDDPPERRRELALMFARLKAQIEEEEGIALPDPEYPEGY